MKLYLILVTIVFVNAGVIQEDKNEELIKINGICHEAEELKTEIDRPYLLAVDYSTNTVHFSYSVKTDDDLYKTAYVNLNTKQFVELNEVNNGFAHAVDQKNHDVYIGGDDGIYKYNHNTKTAEFYGVKDENIWTLFFKDVLYYSEFPALFLYTYINGESVRFKDLEDTKVDQFIIDNEDDMFYTNATGLYSQRKGTKDAKLFQKFPAGGVRALSIDINGNAYVCLSDGIFKVDKTEVALKKVVGIDDAFGLAFDNDNNIVYSDASKLIRLKPNKDKTC